jgi:hypothetical protein
MLSHRWESTNPTTRYKIGSANRNFNDGRPGKIYNYQMLKDKPYFNEIVFTKYQSIGDFAHHALMDFQDDIEFQHVLGSFLDDYYTWDKVNNDDLNLFNAMESVDLAVYRECLFHIIAETRVFENLLSEKTFKIFYTKQIPLMCGPANSMKHLRECGFDVFDDIVDHSHYDHIVDWKQRIIAMHEVLDGVMSLNHEKVLIDTQSRRDNNYELLKTNKIANFVMTPIITKLSTFF